MLKEANILAYQLKEEDIKLKVILRKYTENQEEIYVNCKRIVARMALIAQDGYAYRVDTVRIYFGYP